MVATRIAICGVSNRRLRVEIAYRLRRTGAAKRTGLTLEFTT